MHANTCMQSPAQNGSYVEWYNYLLSVLWIFSFHAAKQILVEFGKQFIDNFNAKAVAFELHREGIISDGVRVQIVQSSSHEQSNNILYDCLQKTSTSESLGTVCDVAIERGTHGYPNMKALGEDMKRRLEEGA